MYPAISGIPFVKLVTVLYQKTRVARELSRYTALGCAEPRKAYSRATLTPGALLGERVTCRVPVVSCRAVLVRALLTVDGVRTGGMARKARRAVALLSVSIEQRDDLDHEADGALHL